MMAELNGFSFGIYVPSYKRAKTTNTYKLVEYFKYVVRKSEEQSYIDAGIPKENILAVEDTEIDSMIKVVNWISCNAEEDVIAMLDDDIEKFIYRLDTSEYFTDPETVTAELERIAQIMHDLKIGYGSVDATKTPCNYCSEFEFKGNSGGMRWINRKVYKSKFLEEIGYCCDIDVVLHELLVNRIILKPKYLCIKAGTDLNAGGNSAKTRASQLTSVELMKSKWGKYYSFNTKSNKPVIRVNR